MLLREESIVAFFVQAVRLITLEASHTLIGPLNFSGTCDSVAAILPYSTEPSERQLDLQHFPFRSSVCLCSCRSASMSVARIEVRQPHPQEPNASDYQAACAGVFLLVT